MDQTTPSPEDPETLKARLEHEDRVLEMKLRVWERAVETQQHFNEMAVKSRQMGLTLVVAALGLAAFLFTRFEENRIGLVFGEAVYGFHVGAAVVLLSAVAVVAVMLLDLGLYHRMLRGSVTFNEQFEKDANFQALGISFGLTTAISHFSRYSDPKNDAGKLAGGKYRTAGDRLKWFYVFLVTFLFILGGALTRVTWAASPIKRARRSTMSHRRRALILDLDNTLYDWVGFFVPAVNALVETASKILAIEPEALRDDLRFVHRGHENSEHPFALLETAAVRDWLDGRPERVAMDALDPAFHAFNHVRRQKLRLYPGVRELLDRLAGQGILVAAFSESRQYGVFDRLSRLGIENAFDIVFCRPPSPSTELVRSSRSAFLRRLKREKYRLLSESFRKPDAIALRDVLMRWGIDPSCSAYVGDSVFKDVLMAREAGVPAVWARYGAVVDSDLYADLVSVSHWTDADIERDKALRAHAGEVRADFVIDDVRDIWDVLQALDARTPRYAIGV